MLGKIVERSSYNCYYQRYHLKIAPKSSNPDDDLFLSYYSVHSRTGYLNKHTHLKQSQK